jgi:hypothetical protein
MSGLGAVAYQVFAFSAHFTFFCMLLHTHIDIFELTFSSGVGLTDKLLLDGCLY